jgi:hypothetical protein
MLVFDIQDGIYDDSGEEHVEYRVRMTRAEVDALRAARRPGQTPELLAAPAQAVAEPIAAALDDALSAP